MRTSRNGTATTRRIGWAASAGRTALGGTRAWLLAGAAFAGMTLGMGGCSNGVQGAMSGAAIGSLAGLGIGSITGDRSDAVTIGAILGGVGGAILGDQNARASAYHAHAAYAPPRPPEPVVIYRSHRYEYHADSYGYGHDRAWRRCR